MWCDAYWLAVCGLENPLYNFLPIAIECLRKFSSLFTCLPWIPFFVHTPAPSGYRGEVPITVSCLISRSYLLLRWTFIVRTLTICSTIWFTVVPTSQNRDMFFLFTPQPPVSSPSAVALSLPFFLVFETKRTSSSSRTPLSSGWA
jgi:hypothetical protein